MGLIRARGGAVLILFALFTSGGCNCSPASEACSAPFREPPHRIISLAPSATEILFALGAGPQVVGRTSYADYPPAARRLPSVGGVQLDLESLVALAPDLVVAESITSPDVVRRLRALGLNVLKVDSSNLDGYFKTLATLGLVTGHVAAARNLSRTLHHKIACLQRLIGRTPLARRPRVFVEIWNRPLQTAGAGTFIDDCIRLAGGRNIFHDLDGYPQVSPEALVVRDPQVVLLTSSTVASFEAREAFAGLTAVRDHAVHAVLADTMVRPSPRLVDTLGLLANYLGVARLPMPLKSAPPQ